MAGFLSTLRRLYLSIYNWTVFYGWLQVLYLALKTLNESGHEKVYDAVEKPLQLAQTAAVMEGEKNERKERKENAKERKGFRTSQKLDRRGRRRLRGKRRREGGRYTSSTQQILHGLVGLVRSPVSATLPQISSRLFVTWGILWSFPETRTHLLVSSLVISWSITEIIRYSFFGMKEALGVAPSWLLWLRYSTFLVLYPTGITSEVGLIYTALPYIKGSDKYCIRMPNKWNFSFDYFYASILALGIYVPGSPHMYQYMLGQRKKALSKSKRE